MAIKLHKEGGETGHFGEFFLGLGLFILSGGVAMLLWGFFGTGSAAFGSDANTAGWLYIVAGLGIGVFGAYGVFSGWGRHHPRFDAGGDPAVPDVFDKEGRRQP